MSVSSSVGLAHSAIIGMRLALPLHTLQPYALLCRHMAPLTQRVPLLFALDQRLTVSFAALVTSLILVSRENLLQARLLTMVLYAATLSMALVQVQSGGVAILRWFQACLQVFPGPVDPTSAPPSSGRGNYLPTQSQTSYHSASSSPSARRPSSGFDGVNEDAYVRRRRRRACRCLCERCDVR